MNERHIPVLLIEVLDNLGEISGGYFADLTFGDGGHTEALLERGAKQVVAQDRDADALRRYAEVGRYRQDPRLKLEHGLISTFASRHSRERFDGMIVDLGVSTRQLMTAARGFSFREEAPLDMRMDRSDDQKTAATILRETPAEKIQDMLEIAGVRGANRLARILRQEARAGRLETTQALARIGQDKRAGRHPATSLFLAVRLLVNRELQEISSGLAPLVEVLREGGKLLLITFHSEEDRLVKRKLMTLCGKCICERSPCVCPRIRRVVSLFRKPMVPSLTEVRSNPRARSAKLRGVMRVIENRPGNA